MAAIGSAIGLGNFWRFPYLCYKWGGGLFFIPYLCSLALLGLPMMLLELSLGQLFQRGDIGVFSGIKPELFGVGLSSVFSAFAINIFYTYLIAIACCYFFASFVPVMPWSVQRTAAYQSVFCPKITLEDGSIITGDDTRLMRPCQPLQVCDPKNVYITEEFFMMDLLKTMVVTADGSCQPFDTGENIAGGDKMTSVFSW